jgi:hypothetical protein
MIGTILFGNNSFSIPDAALLGSDSNVGLQLHAMDCSLSFAPVLNVKMCVADIVVLCIGNNQSR